MVQAHKAQTHRLFFHYSEFPLSMRTVFLGTLILVGIAYVFAMIHIYNSYAGRDGDPMLSVEDLEIAYSGSQEDTRLESVLKGPMSGMLPAEERSIITAWVRRGAERQDYNAQIAPVVAKRCLACHDGSNPHLADLSTYSGLHEFAELDTGTDIFTLVRVSHIHLFGITFLFFIIGFIFSHAFVRPVWLKSAIIAGPFLALFVDVASWYITKLFPPFAWVVLLSGGLMGLCFAIMWLVSAYQILFYKFMRAGEHPAAPIA